MSIAQRRPSTTHLPELRNTLVEMCRPFGQILHWEVQSANDGLYHCRVRLDQPKRQAALAERLGARIEGNELCLEIRLRR